MTEIDHQTHGAGSDLGPVRVTIVVTSAPGQRRSVPNVLARSGSRTVIVLGAVAVAIATAAIAAVLPSSERAVSAGRPSAAVAGTDRESTVFGFRVDCPRLAIVSPDGEYARLDYDTFSPCGSYGNHMTLILHRVRGNWVPAGVGTGSRCPVSTLPARIAIELQLCPGAVTPHSLAARPQRPLY